MRQTTLETDSTLPLAQYRLVFLIIVAGVAYQALLCLINTLVFPVSRGLLAVGEMMILMSCIPLLLPRIVAPALMLAAFGGGILCLLALLRGGLDVKAIRDLLIPLWFYWLGRNIGEPAVADRILKGIIGLVLIFGFFELLATETYTRFFDIFSYYVNTGGLKPITEYDRDSRLQMNGIRPEEIGRTLLPALLGSHRVSSVFLEPVSLGNFATIVAAWGLAKNRSDMRNLVFFMAAAVLMIVLADSRFAVLSVGCLVAVRLLAPVWTLSLPALFPPLIVLGLVAVSLFYTGGYGDTYMGRLYISGEALRSFDSSSLLGFGEKSRYPDEGYAHVLYTFGLPLLIIFWAAFWFIKMPDEQSLRFRCFIGMYITLILCVSGTSVFALKTAALVWFLIGVVQRDPARFGATKTFGFRESRLPPPGSRHSLGAPLQSPGAGSHIQ